MIGDNWKIYIAISNNLPAIGPLIFLYLSFFSTSGPDYRGDIGQYLIT